MCFSTTASLSAGVVLSVIGIACIKKTKHTSQYLFAAIPVFFAIQQFSEGILWLILPRPELASLQKTVTYFFLIFAQVIWPMMVPFAVMFLEKERTRKNSQKVLVAMGISVSLYLAYCLLNFPSEAKIVGHHIYYNQIYPDSYKLFAGVFYVIATIAPPFYSHIKRMWMLGTAILISYIISTVFYEAYLVSVWCFFASIISVAVYAVILEITNAEQKGQSVITGYNLLPREK